MTFPGKAVIENANAARGRQAINAPLKGGINHHRLECGHRAPAAVLSGAYHSRRRATRSGERRVISKQMLYVEIDAEGKARHLQYAPYLDFRPLAEGEPDAATILARPECAWISRDFEKQALGYAIATVVPAHLAEVRNRRIELLNKTEVAVKDRLTKEITYWDHRAERAEAPGAGGPAEREALAVDLARLFVYGELHKDDAFHAVGSASQILSLGMSKTFRPWKIDEPLLLPPVVQEFVAKDHLARFVLSLVRDDIDLVDITSWMSVVP
jgi:hypothetical protein